MVFFLKQLNLDVQPNFVPDDNELYIMFNKALKLIT